MLVKKFQEMLTIYNVEVLDKKKLNIHKKKTRKKQILLFDTQRRIDDYINKIKYRRNGSFDDIPHFIISKQGQIFQIFNTDYSSNTFNEFEIDKKQIKIAIENLGWLKKTLSLVIFIIGLEIPIVLNHILKNGEITIFGINIMKNK